jgi:hypothetical protein
VSGIVIVTLIYHRHKSTKLFTLSKSNSLGAPYKRPNISKCRNTIATPLTAFTYFNSEYVSILIKLVATV